MISGSRVYKRLCHEEPKQLTLSGQAVKSRYFIEGCGFL
jgi:hypothetical protein